MILCSWHDKSGCLTVTAGGDCIKVPSCRHSCTHKWNTHQRVVSSFLVCPGFLPPPSKTTSQLGGEAHLPPPVILEELINTVALLPGHKSEYIISKNSTPSVWSKWLARGCSLDPKWAKGIPSWDFMCISLGIRSVTFSMMLLSWVYVSLYLCIMHQHTQKNICTGKMSPLTVLRETEC